MEWDELLKKQERLILGKSIKDASQRPPVGSSLRLAFDLVTNPIPPRILGFASDGSLLTYSDADRKDHFHIIGSPDQGKSKLLEMMMSEDIIYLQDTKIPFRSSFCFLDAGTNANTLKKVLRFCVQRDFKKVWVWLF